MRTPTPKEIKRTMKKLKEIKAHRGQLDIYVEDIFCQRALRINRSLEKQVEFLLRYMEPDELLTVGKSEVRLLKEKGFHPLHKQGMGESQFSKKLVKKAKL